MADVAADGRQPVRTLWLLADRLDGRPLAECAGIDGLFVDLPPGPPVQRVRLLGCEPSGTLAEACSRPGPVWLGNIVFDLPGDPAPGIEELLDVTVIAHEPSVASPGAVDITLEGRWRPDREYETGTPGAVLTDEAGAELGSCREVVGLAGPPPATGPLAALRGCRPHEPLAPGRRVDAELMIVDVHGVATRLPVSTLKAAVRAVLPSAYGAGLLDVFFDAPVRDPLPRLAEPIWAGWRSGRPAEPGSWTGLDRRLRREWLIAAMAHHQRVPDRPPGTEYHLDGTHVTDIEGFYCALGEAINGPGGYFGWGADDLQDCLAGGCGAATPFRLVWHRSAVAEASLVPGYDRVRWASSITLPQLLVWLRQAGVEVDLVTEP